MLRLVINLDRAQDRWRSVSEQFNRLGIPVERVPAIDWKDLNYEFIKSITAPIDHPLKAGFPEDLTYGEIGCYLSHIKCWKTLLQSDEQWALVMEDDIVLSDRAPKFMLSEDWIPDGVDVVQLHGEKHRPARIRRNRIRISKEEELVQLVSPTPVCMQSYYISRDAAAYAIEQSRLLAAPVDEMFASPYYDFPKKFPIWRLDPCVVVIADMKSTIGTRVRHMKSPLSVFIRRKLLKLQFKLANWNCERKTLTFK